MRGGEADDGAAELLVDLAEDIGGEDGELVGAFGVVEAGDDVLEGLVVDVEPEGELVGGFGAVLFAGEVKDARVVAFVGAAEELGEAGVDARAVGDGLDAGVGLDAPRFRDAEEDDAVDGALDGEVELAL